MSTLERLSVQSRIPKRRGGSGFLAHAGGLARYFGFKHARELMPQERSYTFAKVASAVSAQMETEPALVYYASAAPAHLPRDIRALVKQPEVGEFGLMVVGSEESIAEVLLLRTLATILTEWGLPIVRVRLNALGDKDSKQRFERELGGFLRKHYDSLDDDCRRATAANPGAAYYCERDECRSIVMSGPRAMNFLSEKSRAHFREVLEYVEGLGLPYELDDFLMGDDRESRVTFSVDAPDTELVLGAYGGRYDDHARKIGGKTAVCAASIYFRKGGLSAARFAEAPKTAAPKVYFIQLGVRAKLVGFTVVDIVRRAGVPMTQSFDARSLAPQLIAAKAAGTHYLIIMGAREALDGTVIIRTLDNSTQQTVALKELPRALKSLR